MSKRQDPILRKMLERLHAAELVHLREHCAELAQIIEDLERDLEAAERQGEYWRDQCLNLELPAGTAMGMTKDGTLGLCDLEP